MMAIFPGMHVHPASTRAFGVVGPVGCVHIGIAVSIDISGNGEEHRSESSAGLVGINGELRLTREIVVDIGPTRFVRPGSGSSDHENRMVLVGVSGNGAAKVVACMFSGEGQEQ